MKSIIPGDIVEHRTSDDRYVVATTGLVCCVRMREGARITDFFHAHELEVTEAAERVRGVNYDHCWMAMDAGPPEFDARDGVAGAITCVECGSIFGPRPDPLYGAFQCLQCGAHYQLDGEAEGGIRYIPPLGLREKEGCDTADPEDSVDVPLPDIHGKRCVSCNSWGDASCSRGRPTSRDGSTRACDEWEVRSLRDAMPATTGEPGPIDGQRVPERAELDVEDASKMLADAGWWLVSPDDDIADACATVLLARGWSVANWGDQDVPQVGPPSAEMSTEDAERLYLKHVSAQGLAAALVDKGWTVVVDEDGSRLYPPGQPVPTEDLPEDFAELLRDVATEKLAKTELLRRVTGSAPVVSCNACHFRVTDDCDSETSTGEGECQYFEPTWDDVAVALAGYAIKVKAGVREQDERLSIDEAVGRLTVAGYTVVPPGQPATTGGHPREITEDTLEATENCYCLACDQWQVLRLDGGCGAGNIPDGPTDTCGEWVRTQPTQVRELAHAAVTDLALEEARAVLKAARYTVIAQGELPEPACATCENWLPTGCRWGYLQPDGESCDEFKHRWQDVAEHLSSVIARAHVGEPDEDPQTETEQPRPMVFGVPPVGIDEVSLADQLDWLRANDLPTGKGSGKKAKTAMVIKLLRLGYYDPATVEQLTGELQWPPEAARCPVVGEDGEPCGSETPEACDHPLPAVPGDGE